MTDASRSDRELDLVLFGATGFTGRLTAEYLAHHAPDGLRWGLAGRNEAKLEGVREHLATIDPALGDLPLLAADVTDDASLKDVAHRARVVITTVGPYLTYGEPLVAACADAGTDYVDLTGEPEFVDRMYVAHHATAERTGARLVHACGFDSIPHDLGAYFTVQQLPDDVPITLRGVVRSRGTFSGGTFHSAMTQMSRSKQMRQAHAARRKVEPRPEGRSLARGLRQAASRRGARSLAAPAAHDRPDHRGPQRRRPPGVRPGVPLLPLRRHQDAALRRRRRGRRGRDRSRRPGASRCASRCSSTSRRATAPTPRAVRKSWFSVDFVGEGGGQVVHTRVSGGDPGYDETAKMLAESALSLAFDDNPPTAGQVTTAQAMGDALTERLQAAGIRFEVL